MKLDRFLDNLQIVEGKLQIGQIGRLDGTDTRTDDSPASSILIGAQVWQLLFLDNYIIIYLFIVHDPARTITDTGGMQTDNRVLVSVIYMPPGKGYMPRLNEDE